MQTREHSRSSRRRPLAVVVLTLVGAVAAVALSVAPASASSSSVVPAATTPLVPGILGVVIGLAIGLLVVLLVAARRSPDPDPVAVRPAAADDQVLAELRKLNERLSVLETPAAGVAVAAQADPGTTAPFAALADDVPATAPTPTPAVVPPPAPVPVPAVEDDWTPPEPDAVPEWQPTLPDPEPPEPKDAVTVLEEWTGEDRFQTGSHPVLTDDIAESAPAEADAPAALEETQRFVFPDPLTPEPSESVAAEPEAAAAPALPVAPHIDTPEASPVVADATWEQSPAAETTQAEPDVADPHEVSEPLTPSTGGWQGNAPRAGDLGGGDAVDETAESASRIADWRWGAESTTEDAPTEDPLTTPAWADVTAPVAGEPAEEPQPATADDEPLASTESDATSEDDPLTSPTWADATPAADEAQSAAETSAQDAPQEDPLTAPTWSDTTPTAVEEPTDEESRIAEWHWGTDAEGVAESSVATATEEPAAEAAPATWGEVSAPSDEPLVSEDDDDTDSADSPADDATGPANDAPAPWWPTTGPPEAQASADEASEPEGSEPPAEDVDAPTTESDLTTDDAAVEDTTAVTDGAATIDSLPAEAASDAGSTAETDQVEDWRWTPDDTTTEPVPEPQQDAAPASATETAGQESPETPWADEAAPDTEPETATETAGEESPETPWADEAAPDTEPETATDPVEDWRSTPDDTTTPAAAEPADESTPEAEDAAPDTEPDGASIAQVEDWRWTPEEEVADATPADATASESDTEPVSPAVTSIAEPTAEMPTVPDPSDEGTDPEDPATTEAAHDPLTAPIESLDTDPTEATPLEPPSPANRPPFGSWAAAPADAAAEPTRDDVAPEGLEADDDPEPAPPIWAAPHDEDHDEQVEEESRPLRSRFSSMFGTRSAEPEAEAAPEVAAPPEAAAPPAPTAYDPLSSEYVVPEEDLGSTTPTYHDLEDTISSSVPLYVDPPAEQPAPPAPAPAADPAGGSLLDDFLADDEEGSHAPRTEPAPGPSQAESHDGNDPDDEPDPDAPPSMWRPSRWIGGN